MPLGFTAVIGWGEDHIGRVLLAGLALSLTIEVLHYTGLGRVASTDDVILNMLGAATGVLLGRGFLRLFPGTRP